MAMAVFVCEEKATLLIEGPLEHEYSGYQNVLHFNMLAHSMR